MSESQLSSCGCCAGEPELLTPHNAPGLSAIAYRIGTHSTLLARMLDRLHAQPDPDNPAARPLAALTTRSTDDPAIALLDAWAVVGDVLAFYQERIANEGFLRTAQERFSVLQLARSVGYELSPGVSASTFIAFTVEDAPGSTGLGAVSKGTKIRSVPPPGKLPRTFETSQDLSAKATLNALKPRPTRPQDAAISNGTLYLLGVSSHFPPGTPGLTQLNLRDVYLLNPETALDLSSATVPAVPLNVLYLNGTGLTIKPGDRILLVGKNSAGTVQTLPVVVRAATDDSKTGQTALDLREDETQPATKPLYIPVRIATGQLSLLTFSLTQRNTATLLSHSFSQSYLSAAIRMNEWIGSSFLNVVNNPPPVLPTPDAGIFVLRARLSFFGNNAPFYSSLLKPDGSKLWPFDWDGTPMSIWKDSITGANYPGPDVYLERALPSVLKGSWALFEAPGLKQVYRIGANSDSSITGFGFSGKGAALTLETTTGASPDKSQNFPVRKTTAFLQSEQQALAELPVTDDLLAGSTELLLDNLVTDLTPGQFVIVTGNQVDAPALVVSEAIQITDILHAQRNSTLLFATGLVFGYIRSTVSINGNVVLATDGETVLREVLGNGDGSQSNQVFDLKRPPLTYVSAATVTGAASTLSVRVNDLEWEQTPSLFGLEPNDKNYIVRIEDDGTTAVTFGDGVTGARLPSGQNNVIATYRTGLGLDGNVDANLLTTLQTLPPGIRGATNPVAASGGAPPQNLDSARTNAPQSLLTLDRIVSLEDYEDFAASFAGIGKAQSIALWNGETHLIHLTVAGADGAAVPPTSQTFQALRQAIANFGDPVQQVVLSSYQKLFFNLAASVLIDPRRDSKQVVAAVADTLNAAFAFDKRQFAQAVSAAEIIAMIQGIPGVIANSLSQLYLVIDPNGPNQTEPDPILPAATAQLINGVFSPAQLLLVNPAGISLSEMKA